jgi:hypothetical protein
MTIRASRMRVESSTSEVKGVLLEISQDPMNGALSLRSSGPRAGHPKPIHTKTFLPGLSLRSLAMQ